MQIKTKYVGQNPGYRFGSDVTAGNFVRLSLGSSALWQRCSIDVAAMWQRCVSVVSAINKEALYYMPCNRCDNGVPSVIQRCQLYSYSVVL